MLSASISFPFAFITPISLIKYFCLILVESFYWEFYKVMLAASFCLCLAFNATLPIGILC